MAELPPAGWYPDPEREGATRWWDGNAWAASGAAATAAGGSSDFPEIGAWIGGAFERMWRHWKDTALIGAVTGIASAVLGGFALSLLRDVRWIDGDLQGGGSLALAGVLLLVSTLIGVVGSVAIARLMLWSLDADPRADSGAIEALLAAVGVFPRYLGWVMLYGLVALAAVFVIGLLLLVAPAIGVILIVLLIPLVIYLGVRLAWYELAVVDRPGNPWHRSSRVSHDRFWSALGRLLLQGLIGIGLSIPLSLVVAAAGGGVPGITGMGEVQVETNALDELILVDFSDAFAISAAGYILGAVTAIVSTVVIAGFTTAAMAQLYRTRNPVASGS